MNCFLSPHSQVVSEAAQTLEVRHTGTCPHLAVLGLVWGSAQGFESCQGVVCSSVPVRLGSLVHCYPIFPVCPCRPS